MRSISKLCMNFLKFPGNILRTRFQKQLFETSLMFNHVDILNENNILPCILKGNLVVTG